MTPHTSPFVNQLMLELLLLDSSSLLPSIHGFSSIPSYGFEHEDGLIIF